MQIISIADTSQSLPCPFFTYSVPAGFPSPAQSYAERALDLNEYCIKHPAATYFVRVQGDSMIGANIHHGNILIVDRALTPKHGDIVIAGFHGELTVKRLELHPIIRLVAMNPAYPAITLPENTELDLHGVVTHALHSFKTS